MTGPARTNTTTTAEVLAAHVLDEYANECSCKRWKHFEDPYDVRIASFAQHQADELAAAGLLADPTTRTEWGVQHSQGLYAGEPWSPMTEERARDWAEQDLRRDANRRGEYRGKARVVRRTVTDWTPAEEGPDD